jgi:hypothetical protein
MLRMPEKYAQFEAIGVGPSSSYLSSDRYLEILA